VALQAIEQAAGPDIFGREDGKTGKDGHPARAGSEDHHRACHQQGETENNFYRAFGLSHIPGPWTRGIGLRRYCGTDLRSFERDSRNPHLNLLYYLCLDAGGTCRVPVSVMIMAAAAPLYELSARSHIFVILLRQANPQNALAWIGSAFKVCNISCATADPLAAAVDDSAGLVTAERVGFDSCQFCISLP
jgi:hypothetical protein